MKCSIAVASFAACFALTLGCSKSEVAMTEPKEMVEAKEMTEPNEMVEPPAMADGPTMVDPQVTTVAATVEAKESEGTKVGDAAPSWENLTGTDDKPHSLKDLADAKAVAVVFTCNSCPVAVAYEDRLNQLAKDYKEKGVALVAINVNNNESNKLPAMKERAAEKGFVFDYVYDPSQQIARSFGATCTPHVFLLDAERKIVYMGAIDDNKEEGSVTKHHLKDAIDATLAGEKPATAETKQFGCGIHYE